jgi:hypothetical protein
MAFVNLQIFFYQQAGLLPSRFLSRDEPHAQPFFVENRLNTADESLLNTSARLSLASPILRFPIFAFTSLSLYNFNNRSGIRTGGNPCAPNTGCRSGFQNFPHYVLKSTFQAVEKSAQDHAIADLGLDFPMFIRLVDGSPASCFSDHFTGQRMAGIMAEHPETMICTAGKRHMGVDQDQASLDWIGMTATPRFFRNSKIKPTDAYFVPVMK